MTRNNSIFDLTGRTALITGASRGIGKSIAFGLAEAGATVVMASRKIDELEELSLQLESQGKNSHCFEVDVSDVESIERLYDSLSSENIVADILVNNAGVEQVCTSTKVDEALWDKIVDTNLKGSFFVSQSFANQLFRANETGSIINLGSLTSAVGVPTATAYTSSKSGVLGMTRALSSEWAGQGLRVNAIGPGYFRTELTETFYQDEAWQQAMLEKIPMNRFGNLQDLVGICVFLASNASAYVSGQIFYVDGGYLASI